VKIFVVIKHFYDNDEEQPIAAFKNLDNALKSDFMAEENLEHRCFIEEIELYE